MKDQPTASESPNPAIAAAIPSAVFGLPDYVQPFMDQLLADEKRLAIGCSERSLLEKLAWRRWAKTLRNAELAELAMHIRQECVIDGDNVLSVQLEEIWRRLKV